MLVKLKWGMEYKGILQSFDNYMNFQVRKVVPAPLLRTISPGCVGDFSQ